MEENVANLVLKELREFREESNKKWEENDKRLTNIEGRVTNIEENLTNIEDRVTELETGRKEDREDILDILETMQKSITEKFDQLNKSMDVKFEKVFATEKVSDMEQQIMKEKIDGHEKRLNFYNARIEYLEKWKDEIENGGLYMV